MNTFASVLVLSVFVAIAAASDCNVPLPRRWLGNAWFRFEVDDVNAALARYNSVRDESSNDFWLRYDRKFIGGTANYDANTGVFSLSSNNPDGVGDYEVTVVNYETKARCSSFHVSLTIDGQDKIDFDVETELSVSGNRFRLTGAVWNCDHTSGSGNSQELCDAQKQHTWFAQFLQGCLIRGEDSTEDCSTFAHVWTNFNQ